MLHHASRLTTAASTPFSSILQAAAGRAWTRTRSRCVFHAADTLLQKGVTQADTEADSISAHSLFNGLRPAAQPSSSTVSFVNLSRSENMHPASSEDLAALPPAADLRRSSLEDDVRLPLADSTPLAQRAGPSRKSNDVSAIDTDCLSPEDTASVASGLDPTPSPQPDPPWSDSAVSPSGPHLPSANDWGRSLLNTPILSASASCLPSQPAAVTPSTPHPDSTCPATALSDREFPLRPSVARLRFPRSVSRLRRNILCMLASVLPVSFQRIVDHHAAFPLLHSTDTYNILIEAAIELAHFSSVAPLLSGMKAEGIKADVDTWKLWVRWMVRRGRWAECWEQESARCREDRLEMPLIVWLEFFQGAHRSVPQCRVGSAVGSLRVEDDSDAEVAAHRDRILMQSFPSVKKEDFVSIPPRVILNFVRVMLRHGQRRLAMNTTRTYFASLVRNIKFVQRRQCLKIIHLHMEPCGKRNLAEYYRARKDLFALLGMHPEFEPTSATLFILLGALQTSRICGQLAFSAVLNFVGRWGAQIVNNQVERRLVFLVRKQNNEGLTQKLESYLERLNDARKEERGVEAQIPVYKRKRAVSLADRLRPRRVQLRQKRTTFYVGLRRSKRKGRCRNNVRRR